MKKIIPIINLTTKLALITRTTGYRKDHLENDVEHSYQLALACWSANEQYNLGLNNELILKYALVHDMLEVYIGDIDAFDDPQAILLKKEKEAKALVELKNDYSQFPQLAESVENYEKREILEAKFVNIIDKLIADVNIYYSNSDYYKTRKISIEDWKKWFLKKANYEFLNPKLKPLVDESIQEVETNFKDCFYIK